MKFELEYNQPTEQEVLELAKDLQKRLTSDLDIKFFVSLAEMYLFGRWNWQGKEVFPTTIERLGFAEGLIPILSVQDPENNYYYFVVNNMLIAIHQTDNKRKHLVISYRFDKHMQQAKNNEFKYPVNHYEKFSHLL